MKKHLFTLITSVACLFAASAQAQQCCGDSYYVGALGGLNFASNIHHHNTKVTTNPGYLVGATVGTEICDCFRVEGEFAFRSNSIHSIKRTIVNDENSESLRAKPSTHLRTYSLMANAYYDLDCGYCVRPYVGAGIGYGWTKLNINKENLQYHAKHKRFAWQAMVGADYDVCQDITVGVEYRYFNASKKFHDQAVALTVKYAL